MEHTICHPRDSIRFPAEGWLQDQKRPSTTRRAAKTTCRNPRSCAPRRSDARCHTSAPTRGHPGRTNTNTRRSPDGQVRHSKSSIRPPIRTLTRTEHGTFLARGEAERSRRPQSTAPPRESLLKTVNTPRSKRGVRRTARPIPSCRGLSKRKSPAHTAPQPLSEQPSKNQPTCELPCHPAASRRKYGI